MAGSGGGARGCGSSGGSVLGQICTWAWGNLGKACSAIITHEWRSSHIPHRAGVSEPPASPAGVASAGFSCIIPFRDAPPAQDSPVIS